MPVITVPTRSNTRVLIPAKTKIPKPVNTVEHIGVSAKNAAKMLGLSERLMWTLIKDNKVRSVKCGTRVVVSVQSLKDFVDGKSLDNIS